MLDYLCTINLNMILIIIYCLFIHLTSQLQKQKDEIEGLINILVKTLIKVIMFYLKFRKIIRNEKVESATL